MTYLEFLDRLHMKYLLAPGNRRFLCRLASDIVVNYQMATGDYTTCIEYLTYLKRSLKYYFLADHMFSMSLEQYFREQGYTDFWSALPLLRDFRYNEELVLDSDCWKYSALMYHLRLDFINWAIQRERSNDLP